MTGYLYAAPVDMVNPLGDWWPMVPPALPSINPDNIPDDASSLVSKARNRLRALEAQRELIDVEIETLRKIVEATDG